MKKTPNISILLIGGILIAIIFLTSCGASKNGYGCPKAKTGKTHDKNVRFNN